MKILLINPPYLTLTSRLGTGHQIPIGLLMVGGPLIDAGHDVRLLDAERNHLSSESILEFLREFSPDIVMTGHSGSTPAHPICVKMLASIKRVFPEIITVYGGVFPTFHADQILRQDKKVDVIVCGEGEAVSLNLVEALKSGESLDHVRGIAYRNQGKPKLTTPSPPIQNLDSFRIGWELIENWDHYQCFGLGRSAIIQFSRGCPHRCTYCGQKDFWVEWRHRDPVKTVDEIEWLYRTHQVHFVNMADENPAANKGEWHRFLEEMASRELPVHFFTSIRTTDIVRDANILPLYKKAGVQYILLGIESVEPDVLRKIKKGSTTRQDLEACRLLKKHGIFSIIAHVVGLKDETWKTFRTAAEQLAHYDGDFVNVTYVTPHSWTEFGRRSNQNHVIQLDQSKWDYRHQVLDQTHLSPWKIFLATKLLEFRLHARPGKLWSIIRNQDRFLRKQLLWCFLHTGLLWLSEVILLKSTRSGKKYSRISDHSFPRQIFCSKSSLQIQPSNRSL